ncbi:MAG: anthranilate phosphoribosyltransferase [Deltaproteobacteria bacterium RBG_16_50_11]|nr:MAG: anthranilate phosphoribosyltransferase [Deltaproteobacteria bacterium RBG_16_50_11]
MIREAIGKIVSRRNLAAREMEEVMREITERMASPEQVTSFITALRMKGETPEEITAAAKVIREKIPRLEGREDVVSLDREEITVEKETILNTLNGSTGGTNIFNVSTATALIAAGGGLKVAKYGRRSYSPLCGCADVIEALGINLDMTPTQLERCLKEVGICFYYDPLAQNGLEPIITLRRKIGIRTIFNILDPLINPAGAGIQFLGVYDPNLTEAMATVLESLGIRRALVVHGEDTLDEISLTGKTKVTEYQSGRMKSYFIEPEDFGMKKSRLDEIRGGTGKQNADIILEILRGCPGSKRDIAVLNAAAAYFIAGKVKDFKEGIELANQSIDSGKALHILKRLIEFTQTERRYLRNGHEDEMAHRESVRTILDGEIF